MPFHRYDEDRAAIADLPTGATSGRRSHRGTPSQHDSSAIALLENVSHTSVAPNAASYEPTLLHLLTARIVKGFGCRPVATVRQAPGPASETLQGRNPRVVGHAGAASAMGISRSRTGCSIEASGGVQSRLGWRWGEAAAPSRIGLCDAPATGALSAAERVVADERRRGRAMTGASDARYDGRSRVRTVMTCRS